ncbi:MAG: lysylphosphatidylglycerol synthase transmembrane domain-containing protein [Acidobacteriota bacterium]|nr:lysylphosphatidylglycerol synthase transmembrane domain-containing protein [Acidobacteriota bacterium]
MKKNIVRFGLAFLLSLAFLYFFFRSVNWSDVIGHLTRVKPVFALLLVFLVPIHIVTRSLRWRFLLVHEKPNVKFSNMFAGNAVGFTVTLIFPGRLGELVKPLYLAGKERMRKGFVIGTVVVERIFDVFTMCTLLALFLLAKPLYDSLFKVDAETIKLLKFSGFLGAGAALAVLLVSLSLYFFRERTLRVFAWFLRPFPAAFSGKVLNLAGEFIEGLKFFHSVGNLLAYAAMSFVVWLGIVLYYWILFFAYGHPVPFFTLIPYVFLTMIGASIPTPGMVGGFHFFSRMGIMSLFPDIDPNMAVSMTIVVHAVQVVVTCLIGYAILWKDGLSLLQLKKLGESADP